MVDWLTVTSTANLTREECAQRAAAVEPEAYRLHLDLSTAPDATAETFTSTSTIVFAATGDQTWVDVIADEIERATLNGEDLDVSAYDGARLPVPGLQERNELEVVARCRFSRTGEGLHRFTDAEDENTYLYTHFEPTDARRMFACFEQPDLKARFTVRVTAPAEWVVRSGQAEVERDETYLASGSTATVTFGPTPPQSTYLVALAAGPYHVAEDEWSVSRDDGTEQIVPLTLLCRQAMAKHLDADDIFEVTKQGLTFFDETFGFPYPWGKYDQVFVPEYNLGAMENPGLVTFTEDFLHRGRSTAQQREARAEVIMHEMSHMWFGDLATMRWWDGLWLKESFADLMGYHVASAATRYTDAWTAFVARKSWAYRADQLPSTHPIVATIDDLEAARQNFDGITYAKGASVIKQLMAYAGADAFFAGAREYFARHAFGSTELDDLLVCLEEASGRDLQTWSRLWLQTAGISTLRPDVTRDGSGAITRLVVRQDSTDPTTGEQVLRPHRIRIGLYSPAGDGLERTGLLEVDVDGAETEVPEAVGSTAPLLVLNDDDLTFAKVQLDEGSLAVLRERLSALPETLTRALVWSDVWNATRDAALPAADFLDLVIAQAPREPEGALLRTVLERALVALRDYLPADRRPAAAERLVTALDAGMRAAEPGSDLQLIWARALAGAAGDTPAGSPLARALLDGGAPEGLEIDDDLRWALWTALTAQDAATTDELEEQLRRDRSMSGRTAYVRATASRPTAEAKQWAWQRITTDEKLTNDELRSLILGFIAPSGAAETTRFADDYYASLVDWWRARTQTMALILAVGLFPKQPLQAGQAPEDNPAAAAASAWLEANADAPAGLRRSVLESRDDLLRALRAQEAGAATTGTPRR